MQNNNRKTFLWHQRATVYRKWSGRNWIRNILAKWPAFKRRYQWRIQQSLRWRRLLFVSFSILELLLCKLSPEFAKMHVKSFCRRDLLPPAGKHMLETFIRLATSNSSDNYATNWVVIVFSRLCSRIVSLEFKEKLMHGFPQTLWLDLGRLWVEGGCHWVKDRGWNWRKAKGINDSIKDFFQDHGYTPTYTPSVFVNQNKIRVYLCFVKIQ